MVVREDALYGDNAAHHHQQDGTADGSVDGTADSKDHSTSSMANGSGKKVNNSNKHRKNDANSSAGKSARGASDGKVNVRCLFLAFVAQRACKN